MPDQPTVVVYDVIGTNVFVWALQKAVGSVLKSPRKHM